MNDFTRIMSAAYAPPDSQGIAHFGPDPCWSPDRERYSPETCPECRGYQVSGTMADPLRSGLDPKTGKVVAYICQGCGRSLVHSPRGRLAAPDQKVLDQLGDLNRRQNVDRTAEAVKLSRRGQPRRQSIQRI